MTALLAMVGLTLSLAAFWAPRAAAAGGTTIQVPSQCSLVNAMQAAQDDNAHDECGTGTMTGPYSIVLASADSPYVLTSANNYVDGPNGLPDVTQAVTVESSSSTQVVIERSSAGGAPAFRIFHVSAPLVSGASTTLGTAVPGVPGVTQVGSLTLQDVEVENGLARGGNGAGGGGGGLGAGGAIFSHGGDVTIDDSTLAGNTAQGGSGAGTGTSSVGGGGGMGGNGGASYYTSAGGGATFGGGGGGTETAGGNANGSGSGAGGGPNGGTAGAASASGGAGGYNGGGGGGGNYPYTGGNGGFGGGGGGNPGNVTYGGYGGGAGSNSGNGGFGGGGSLFGNSGFSGGAAPFMVANGGGGGAGLGGAVFALGGSLILNDAYFQGGAANGGSGASGASAGSGYGGAVFIDGTNNGSTAYSATGGMFSGDTASTSSPDVYTYGATVAPTSANGSGTMTVSPADVTAGSTTVMTFSYTAATGGLSNGGVKIAAPPGWSLVGSPTASTGTVGITDGGTISVSGVTLTSGQTLTITSGVTAGTTPGFFPFTVEENSTSMGTLTGLASQPNVEVLSADGSGTMAVSPSDVIAGSSNTLTFTYTAASGGLADGEVRVDIPSGWSAPSTIPGTAGYSTASAGAVTTCSGGTECILVTNVTLAAGGTLTITYGSGDGASAAVAPSTTGASAFTALEMSAPDNNVVEMANPPTLTVGTALSVATSSLPTGTVGTGYTAALSAAGGASPYTWTATGLPAGLSQTVTGSVYRIQGVPTVSGTVPVTLKVTDSSGASRSTTLNLTITPAPIPLAITPASLPNGNVGVAYGQTLQATGGTEPYIWSLTSGSLPSGLSLTTTGAVYGTPTSAGTSTFTYQVIDSSTTPEVRTGSATITVSGSDEGISVSAVPGSVPAGQTTQIEGTVSGSVYREGEFHVGGLPGVSVLLSASRGDGSAAVGSFDSSSPVTEDGGTYRTNFTAPQTPGAVTVTASVYSAVYGSESAQTVIIVTAVGTTTKGTDTATSTGGCAAQAAYDETSETGCGRGILAVAQYNGNPAQTQSLVDAIDYFDAAVSKGNTFSSVSIKECGVQSGDTMEWWNHAANSGQGAWQAVSPAAVLQGICLAYTATGNTAPSLADLYGTVFAVVAPPPPPPPGSVTTASGTAPAAIPAAVTGLEPASGTGAGGTLVYITGHGFTGATAVDFGTAAAESFHVISDSSILAVAPAGSGSVNLHVVTNGVLSPVGPANLFAYSPCATSFADVPAGYWAQGPIEVLACNGIIGGFPNGLFEPDGSVTRAQFVKMLDLTLGLQIGAVQTPFADVPATAWDAPYVAAAINAGLVQGVTPTTFDPNGLLTRQQMAVLLARALKLTQTQPLTFTDAAGIAPWATADVQEAVAAGYLSGFPNGTFQPTDPAARAQAVQVLSLMLKNRGA